MKNVTRTVYGAGLQTAQLCGIDHNIQPYTTLNEKLGILADQLPARKPTLDYFALGIGGHRMTTGANGRPKIVPEPHEATDAGPYELIPMVVRSPGSDLDPVRRRQYAYRKKIEDPNGNPLIAYYAKKLDKSDWEISYEYRVVDANGTIVDARPFIPDASNLSPIPRNLANTGVNTLDRELIVVNMPATIRLVRAEIDDLLNVGRVLFDDEDIIVLSELMLLTGDAKNITVDSPPEGSFVFEEIVGGQIAGHLSISYATQFTQNLIEMKVNVGAQEPLQKFTPRP